MYIPPRIIKDNTLNCFQLAISSLAEQQGTYMEDLWYQAGFYFEDLGDEGFLLDPRYKPIEQQILKGNSFEAHEFFEVQECLDQVHKYIAKGIPIALTVDNYELKHSNSFQIQHYPHLIEINSRHKNIYQVTDHFFHFQGEMTIEELFTSTHSYLEQYKYLRINLFFAKEKNTRFSIDELVQIVRENYQIMSGQSILDVKLPGELGIDAFLSVTKKLLRCLNGDGRYTDDLDHWFNAFKDVGNSRFNFYRLLHRYYPEMDFSFLNQASQNWISLGNMLIKAQYQNSWDKMNDRINRRLNKTISQEKENLLHLEKVLTLLSDSLKFESGGSN
jgi:hypothetical protein